MLRRFNSLIKGPKVGAQGQIITDSDDEGDGDLGDISRDLHVALRPALSVDSSLFTSSQHHHVNPLQQQLARARQESLTNRARNVAARSTSSSTLSQQNLTNGVINTGKDIKSQRNGSTAFPAPKKPISRTSSQTIVEIPKVPVSRTSSQTIVEIPDAEPGSIVDLENVRRSAANAGPGRTISSWSTDSAAEHCRICQQHTEEPLIELGCLCRGEMSKSHKSCIETWFKNKGTNQCEVCQHVAENIAAPETSPPGNFWAWRLGGAAQGAQGAQGAAGGRVSSVPPRVGITTNRPVLLLLCRNHPLIPVLWLGLLGFMTYLFVDAIQTSTIGFAAMPIGFLFGVLVVLGLGTAVRLVLEYQQERNVQRTIHFMEMLEEAGNNAGSTNRQTGPSSV